MIELHLEPAGETTKHVPRGSVRPLTEAMMKIAAHPSEEWQKSLKSRNREMGLFMEKSRREAIKASEARLAELEAQEKSGL